MSSLLADRAEFGKCHILIFIRGCKAVIWSTRTFEYKTTDGSSVCYHTPVTYTYECLTITVTDIIVWSFLSRKYSKNYYLLPIDCFWDKVNFWDRIHLSLDSLTDNLTILFAISKSNNLSVVVYTKLQLTTHAISKGRDTLKPALRLFIFEHLLLVIFRRLTYPVS